MNVHLPARFSTPVQALFPSPGSLNLAYGMSRGVSILCVVLSDFEAERQKEFFFMLNEAGMSMKTKKTWTVCPPKKRTFPAIGTQVSDILCRMDTDGRCSHGFSRILEPLSPAFCRRHGSARRRPGRCL